MARDDWDYINIPKQMSDALKVIVEEQGNKYGILGHKDLARYILRRALINWEKAHRMIDIDEVSLD